jgi:hypothetical protein
VGGIIEQNAGRTVRGPEAEDLRFQIADSDFTFFWRNETSEGRTSRAGIYGGFSAAQ